MRKALIFWGGWDGHEPEKVARRIKGLLEAEGFRVDVFHEAERLPLNELASYELLFAAVTMSEMPGEVSRAIAKAVGAGLGLAGCHGGMCDAFRNDTEWQFMTGGQWVSHPGGDQIAYTVNLVPGSPLTEGLEDFPVCTEHYYLHVDPAVEVLATTRFPLVSYYHAANRPVDMPVAWTKYWGLGRVFYLSLGHHDDLFDQAPTAQELLRRGMLWAAGGREAAKAEGLTAERFLNDAKMY
jgi:type 1 glutamine amidotransferase